MLMIVSLHHRLSGILFILAILASTLGAFTHRFATKDDLALAQFVAMGGTADDLCSAPDPQALIDGLQQLCAPVNAPAITPPTLALHLLLVRAAILSPRIAPVAQPRAVGFARPGIRAPPVTA